MTLVVSLIMLRRDHPVRPLRHPAEHGQPAHRRQHAGAQRSRGRLAAGDRGHAVESRGVHLAGTIVTTPVTVNVNKTDYTVALATPVCVKTEPVTGNSYDNSGLALQDTYWDVQTTATNAKSGASVTTNQGVKVRLNASATCP